MREHIDNFDDRVTGKVDEFTGTLDAAARAAGRARGRYAP